MKTLAISILNWNWYQDTIDCIESLKQSDFQDFDIYLLDNGSRNNEWQKLKELYKDTENIIITVLDVNAGFTGGNNENLRQMVRWNYEFFLLLNNDTIIPEKTLWDFIQKAKLSDGWIFWPIVREYYDKNIVQSCGNITSLWTGGWSRLKQLTTDYTPADYVSGACFLITKKTLDTIGLLDDRYFAYWEENDYCHQAKKMWISTYVINGVEVYHKEESARKKTAPYYTYLMFRNRLLFLSKHANRLQYAISWIFLIAYSFSLFPIRFWIRNYKYLLRAVKDYCLNIYGKGSM